MTAASAATAGPFRAAWKDNAIWSVCFALAVVLHAGGAYALLHHWHEDAASASADPIVMIELAPVPVAPEAPPTLLQAGPQDTPSEPMEEQEPEPEVMPEPPKDVVQMEPEKPVEVTLPKPEKPKPKPQEKPKPKPKPRVATAAPTTSQTRAERAAAPDTGAASNANSNAIPNWRSQLAATLERNKRYPSDARARGDAGVVMLAFRVDRSGHVLGAHIVRGSGSAALDSETLSLAQRVSPVPAPPREMPGASIAITVPIRYSIR